MRRFAFLTLLAALLIVGCTEVTIEQSNPLTEINSLPDLTASFANEGETRTFVEDSKYLRWHEADLITAFFGNTLNRQYKFKGKTGDNSGTFSLVPSGKLGTGNDLSSIYAVYPYDENTTITDNGVISLTLPATQTYAENSFGKGANTMVAVTESVENTFLSFKNACGYLKLKLYGDNVTIASIEVKGNNEEKIAGSATATMEFGGVPTIAMNDEATTSVTLDCGEGVAIGATADTATEFWFVLPETTFEGGITITATNTDGSVFSKSTTNTVAITRNDIQPMVALKAEFATAKPANNEIWYTSSDASVVTPNNTAAFGANVVSNVYENSMGIITFDGEVTKIGEGAFASCISLTNVTIPDSVTKLEIGAFAFCTLLTNVTIPDSVTNIGEQAFMSCTSLTSVTIPDSVTAIEGYAFADCPSLTHVTIPDSVTSIGGHTFSGCLSLTSITIPDSVTSIGSLVFEGCKNLKKFEGKFAADNGRCLIKDNVIISYANASGAEYTIPDSVTKIGDWVFIGCTSLTSVTISDSVTSIGKYAFNSCTALKSVTIPDSVTSIGGNAFSNCTSLTSVTIPDSVTEIGGWVFSDCTSLIDVYCKATTPPTATGGLMFDDNALDRKIYVPAESVELYKGADRWSNYADYIVGYNFETGEVVPETPVGPANNEIWYTNGSTTTATAPYKTDFGGATIQSNTYNSNDECWVIKFDKDITAIGYEAFKSCSNLESVYIPTSVELIDGDAFYNCSSLKEVYCMPTTPPACRYGAFPFDSTIYVPSASVSAYKSAPEYWTDYTDKIVGYDF